MGVPRTFCDKARLIATIVRIAMRVSGAGMRRPIIAGEAVKAAAADRQRRIGR
jgi:hypothetical protein